MIRVASGVYSVTNCSLFIQFWYFYRSRVYLKLSGLLKLLQIATKHWFYLFISWITVYFILNIRVGEKLWFELRDRTEIRLQPFQPDRMEIKNLVDDFKMNRHLRQCRRYFRNIMWGMFIAGGVIYTLQNIQENTQRYLQMKTRTEVVAERNANKAFPIVTICLNSMHSRGKKRHRFWGWLWYLLKLERMFQLAYWKMLMGYLLNIYRHIMLNRMTKEQFDIPIRIS